MAKTAGVIRLPIKNKSPASFRQFDDKALTQVERRYKKLAKQLKSARGSSNVADIRTLRELLVMTMELVPIAKESYRQYRSDRSIYALNGLVNQIRELMNDLRQLRTGKKQHRDIVNKIVVPNLSMLMQHYMADCSELKKQISRLDGKNRRRLTETLNTAMQQQGALFNQTSTKIQEMLAEYLVA